MERTVSTAFSLDGEVVTRPVSLVKQPVLTASRVKPQSWREIYGERCPVSAGCGIRNLLAVTPSAVWLVCVQCAYAYAWAGVGWISRCRAKPIR